MDTKTVQRRYDLDWLRGFTVFAIFALHHATRFFDTDDWFIKNATTYLPMQVWLEFCTSWGMPLILIISGASAFLALEKIRPGKYIAGLFLRLFVPLIVGMFTHIAFMIYLEHLHKGKIQRFVLRLLPALLRRHVRLRRQLRLDGIAPVVPGTAFHRFPDMPADLPLVQTDFHRSARFAGHGRPAHKSLRGTAVGSASHPADLEPG